MPFLGLMRVSSHDRLLENAKRLAFSSGQDDGRASVPAYEDLQPEVDTLKGQLDAAIELEHGYADTIGAQKDKITKLAAECESLAADAQKWRDRNAAERARQQKKRREAATPTKKTAFKRATKK